MLVFLHIEGTVVIPAESNSKLKTLEAVEVSAAVSTVTHGCITVRNEFVVVGTECLPGLVSRLLEHDNHEGSHEESGVALLGVVQRSVVVNFVVLVLLVVHQLFKLLAEEMNLAQVERAKVSEEGFVDKVIVDAEVEGVLPRLGRVLVTDPVQSAGNYFHRLIGV